MNFRPRLIAYYLPQYHPFKENNEWWGPGFTEWTNVAKARPLFNGHKQPHIPADFGFYDLRYPEIKEQQAQAAKEAGIEGFCYYHYWFGNGKRLMEKPFNQVIETGKPDFPFCLCWANHSWYKKLWDPNNLDKDRLLIEQKYGGVDDYTQHFYELLPAFKDSRYIKVNNKLFFIIYDGLKFTDVRNFIKLWQELAVRNGLNGFYFVTTDADSRNKKYHLNNGFDAIHNVDILNIHHHLSKSKKYWLRLKRKYLHKPTVFQYKEAIKYMVIDDCRNIDTIPVIAPNWDHTPRSKSNGFVLQDCHPKYFKQLIKRAFDVIKDKPKEEQIIIIKSWNEWGEGNYLEPDLEVGHGYLDALKECLHELFVINKNK